MHRLIFDIGKTNKKWVIYDDQYKVVKNHSIYISEIEDHDGDPCEDLGALVNWIKGEVKKLIQSKDYKITHINFSAYGATLVNVDENGSPCTPVYNYLKETKRREMQLFEGEIKPLNTFYVDTGAPFTGMLNTGYQLFWLKNVKPRLFKKIKYSLHLPQYLSSLFTNKYYSEMTSMGCHTCLWNFKTKNRHKWVKNQQFDPILPDMISTSNLVEVDLYGNKVKIGMGIHDSSAALVPYLKATTSPFLLLSTGTWSITLNPFDNEELLEEDLKNDVLFYLQPNGSPVRASRLFLGRTYTDGMTAISNKYKKGSQRFLLEVQKLNKKLADKHHRAILKSANKTKIEKIFIDGGFVLNKDFMQMLKRLVYPTKLYYAAKPLGSALGAALVMSEKKIDDKVFTKIFEIKSM